MVFFDDKNKGAYFVVRLVCTIFTPLKNYFHFMSKNSIIALGLALCMGIGLASCRSHYEVSKVTVARTPINESFDAAIDQEAVNLITPYSQQLENTMNSVVGYAEMSMDKNRPEDLLGNLVADVLRQAGARVLGSPADVGLMNIGGIRNVLTQGDITVGNVFEILPFENALCVVRIKGSQLRKLFTQIAGRGGEAISGARIVISHGDLLSAEVGGEPLDDNKIYTLATIDYVAEGNDGMSAIREVESKDLPDNAVLRDVFMDYVKQCTARGEKITSKKEGRVTVK